MLLVVWLEEALDDLEGIVDFIETQNPAAADRTGQAIRHTAERLADHPHMHRPGRIPGTREALVTPTISSFTASPSTPSKSLRSNTPANNTPNPTPCPTPPPLPYPYPPGKPFPSGSAQP